MITSEEVWLGSRETDGLRLAHPYGRYTNSLCTDVLDLEFPSDLGHDPRKEKTESSVKIGDSDPSGIGRDDLSLEDMFHECDISDIFDVPPTGSPILWEDVCSENENSDVYSQDSHIYSENSDDYNVYEDPCDEFAHMETNCPGRNRNIPMYMAKKISYAWIRTIVERNVKYNEKCEEINRCQDEDADFPPFPLEVFPETTSLCVHKGLCHHIEYRTHDTSTTESSLGCGEAEQMLQIFSLRLSGFSLSYPVSVYGVCAVRDELEPLRNHVFNRSRDDAVTADKDLFTLPLCSPCRGMYLPYDRALLEVDLWIKNDDDGDDGPSTDQQLLFAYVELEVLEDTNGMINGCVLRDDDRGSLEIDYLYLTESVEAVIEVSAEVTSGADHHVRFVAFTSGYVNEIVLFDDEKFSGKKKVFKHLVAVKADAEEGELIVRLEVEKTAFQWTFRQDGNVNGALSSPDDSILKYGQFDVSVCFAPKKHC